MGDQVRIRELEFENQRLLTCLGVAYLSDRLEISRVCDDVVDPSGRLLGMVRKEACKLELEGLQNG